jgi:MoxR-like ATPase
LKPQLYQKFKAVQDELQQATVERYDESHGLIISLITGLNALLVGSPGTAKSMLSTLLLLHIKDATKFQRLVTVFSTPEELFGPPDMALFKNEHIFRRNIEGMLPEADLVFLDEIFKANAGILNSLLEILNERMFSDGKDRIPVPMLFLVGASNEIPDPEDKLGALYDRLVLKYEVKPIKEPGNFMDMLLMPDTLPKPKTLLTLDEIKIAREEVRGVEIDEKIITKLAQLRNELNNKGLMVTDRTFKVSLKALKAEAYLHGRTSVNEEDIDILRHAFWTEPKDKPEVYMTILGLVNPEKQEILKHHEQLMALAAGVFAEKDAKKQLEQGLETAAKFKAGIQKVKLLISKMKEKGKSMDEVNFMLTEILNQQKKIYIEACGLTQSEFGS